MLLKAMAHLDYSVGISVNCSRYGLKQLPASLDRSCNHIEGRSEVRSLVFFQLTFDLDKNHKRPCPLPVEYCLVGLELNENKH